MIRFHFAKVDKKNCIVKVGLIEAKDNNLEGFVERDAEGNLDVTIDTTIPKDGEPVTFINHKEKDNTYQGVFRVTKDQVTLDLQNVTN